ncbi:hypothetical protein C5612_03950 [Pseudomonas frederiksbergensis]|uniref:Uncharacterized protein n=1 Tax=Pseudomonas frederiksbergensis TaxID=104087 RepID=A0A2S8HTB8_9PSED|nr:hypothetical protein C5612_03950 [Pseudomonas frederiksbergensis]
MGAGLLAKAVYQSTSLVNVRPHSRANPLPQWFCVCLKNLCPFRWPGRRPWSNPHPVGRS